MPKVSLKAGTTSYITNVFIQDSASTTGAGKTGLAYNTASLTAYYVRPGVAAASITLATQTATGAYSSGGFAEVDATNLPGVYRLDIPDAAIAAGAKSVVIMLKGASGMAPLLLEIELTAIDNQDSVRVGLSALPNATAGANGGLPLAVDASGRVDVLRINGTSQTARDIGASVLLSNGTGTGQISLASGAVTVGTNNDKTGYSLAADQAVNITKWNGTAVTGMPLPTSGYTAPDNALIAAIKAKTDNLPSDPADQSLLEAAITAATSPLATASAVATLAGYVDTEVAAVKAVTDKLDTAMELDGAVYRFTVNALEQAPAGGGGSVADWTSGEREQIRYVLGIDGTKTAATGGQIQTIKTKTDALPSDPADQSLLEAAITAATSPLATASAVATLAGYVDTEVAAIKGVTDKLDTAMELDGAVYRFTINALERAPTGTGGGGGGADILAVTREALESDYDPDTVAAAFLKLLAVPTDTAGVVPGPPPDVEHGRVYVFTGPLLGSPRAGISLHIALSQSPSVAAGRALEAVDVTFSTDSNGLASAILPLTSNILPAGRVYVLNCPTLNWRNIQFEMTADKLDVDGNFDLSTLAI